MAKHQKQNQKAPGQAVQHHPKAEPTSVGPASLPDLAAPGVLRRAVDRPSRMSPGGMPTLQRAYGNRAVTGLLPGSPGRSPGLGQVVIGPSTGPHVFRKIEASASVPLYGFLYPTYYGLLTKLNNEIKAYNVWDKQTRLKVEEKESSLSTKVLEAAVHNGIKMLDTVEHRAYEWFGKTNPKSGDTRAKQVLRVLNQAQGEHKYWTGVIVEKGLNVWTVEAEEKEEEDERLQEVWQDIVSEHEVFDFTEKTLLSSGWRDVDKETMYQFKLEMYSMLARLLSRPRGRRLLISLYETGKKTGKKLTFGPRSEEDIPGYRANVGKGQSSFLATESKGTVSVKKGAGTGADVVVAPGIRESSFSDRDRSGRPIVAPSFVGLGHELIHALHYMTGTWWSRVKVPGDHPARGIIDRDYGGDLEEFVTIAPKAEIRKLLGGTQLTIDVKGQPKPVPANVLLGLMKGMPTEASIRKEHGLGERWGHKSTASPWEYGESATEKDPGQVVKDSIQWWEKQLEKKDEL